ncbi:MULTISPECIES: anthranilate 1,2-dioxygenase system ferredoxin--NAD(+) reductase [unclassified Caballeronia]|uniref:anthranilate 1,2-dioxygenase system ferredoxin--NAD(+) reductase n=1 Tax=unclassified Caballeronia TaxID=2646786 RepID=UPI00285E41A4|nr:MULTISPECIES: anthranilate 1,2-dioxygenase system ferredoxin--NAD(+) reductase [unclassified Caballeronia]MDR5776469.1 FAD-dependent oxidoreductase [Caballeronia sp. LZ002]MDR5806605.1 FAD-dependent oxidoreductase [Caballeronia sp. LZ001]MDR5851749.1 FAD-dependent oxidoreductase [Caballeronia sp. LZ003]
MSTKHLVIVGAGHAARRAAESLREQDAHAAIVMIGDERALPYDRPELSKAALLSEDGEKRIFIRDAAWYDTARIDVRLGVRVDAIDRAENCVVLNGGARIEYESLLLATGSRVRPFPGHVDEGVKLHYIRTVEDTRALRRALMPGRRVAVIGGGFIGLEVAASATKAGCAVTLVEPAERLLMRSMPRAVAEFIHDLHRSKGVDVRTGTTPLAVRQGAASTIVETDHGAIDADIVVVGIGVVPNTELALQAGLAVENGIVVDAQCRTGDPSIFAAGEVTSHFNSRLGRHVRVESWQVAENQPVVAAENMLGGAGHYAEIPWLWSDQYDCNLQTLGLFHAAHALITRGDPSSGSFCVLGLNEARQLEAVAGVNAGRDIGACKRLIAAGNPLDPETLRNTAIPLRGLL